MKIKVIIKPIKSTPKQIEAAARFEDALYKMALKQLAENLKHLKPVKVG